MGRKFAAVFAIMRTSSRAKLKLSVEDPSEVLPLLNHKNAKLSTCLIIGFHERWLHRDVLLALGEQARLSVCWIA